MCVCVVWGILFSKLALECCIRLIGLCLHVKKKNCVHFQHCNLLLILTDRFLAHYLWCLLVYKLSKLLMRRCYKDPRVSGDCDIYSFCCLCSEDQNAGYPMHVGCRVETFERAVGGFLSAKLRMKFEQSCKKCQLLIAKSWSRMYKSWIQLIEALMLTKLKYGWWSKLGTWYFFWGGLLYTMQRLLILSPAILQERFQDHVQKK